MEWASSGNVVLKIAGNVVLKIALFAILLRAVGVGGITVVAAL
jgi:hypothetical protein